MRTPDRAVVKELKKLDDRLSVQWNTRRSRWQIFYKRRLLRLSERARWSHVCTFYRGGNAIRLYEPKPTDQWHIAFWEGENEEYRPLDSSLVEKLREWDTWRAPRVQDLWLDKEREMWEAEEKLERELHDMHYDWAYENDAQLRKQMIPDLVDSNRTYRSGHTPTNWQVGSWDD